MAVAVCAPLQTLNGPRPVAPRYGLVQAAGVVPDGDEHWLNGAAIRPYPVSPVAAWDPLSLASGPNVKDEGETPPAPEFQAYALYLPETCTARGVGPLEEFRARATTAFAAREGGAVEHEFWTGSLIPANPHLMDGNATVLAVASTSPTNGLAMLEQAIADTQQAGMIHATPATVTAWVGALLLQRNGANLETMLGTTVVPGVGYPGTGPGTGALSATEDWAFATGMVEVRRTEPFLVPDGIEQALLRSMNDVTYRAERYVLTTWDTTLQAGVIIDRCQTDC